MTNLCKTFDDILHKCYNNELNITFTFMANKLYSNIFLSDILKRTINGDL